MKGVPSAPRCGFSNAVVQIMDIHGVDKYTALNVLEDDDLRENIKEYSDWPTIPQVSVSFRAMIFLYRVSFNFDFIHKQ